MWAPARGRRPRQRQRRGGREGSASGAPPPLGRNRGRVPTHLEGGGGIVRGEGPRQGCDPASIALGGAVLRPAVAPGEPSGGRPPVRERATSRLPVHLEHRRLPRRARNGSRRPVPPRHVGGGLVRAVPWACRGGVQGSLRRPHRGHHRRPHRDRNQALTPNLNQAKNSSTSYWSMKWNQDSAILPSRRWTTWTPRSSRLFPFLWAVVRTRATACSSLANRSCSSSLRVPPVASTCLPKRPMTSPHPL